MVSIYRVFYWVKNQTFLCIDIDNQKRNRYRIKSKILASPITNAETPHLWPHGDLVIMVI